MIFLITFDLGIDTIKKDYYTCPKGTKGGGPPSVPMLLLLCFDKLCKIKKKQQLFINKLQMKIWQCYASNISVFWEVNGNGKIKKSDYNKNVIPFIKHLARTMNLKQDRPFNINISIT